MARPAHGKRHAKTTPDSVTPEQLAGQEPVDGGVLLEFRHGLGDLLQLSCVLRHLAAKNPGAAFDVVCAEEKVLSHSGFERARFGFQDPRYKRGGWDQVIPLHFPDFAGDVAGFPNTKVWRCLTEVLKMEPALELFRYAIVVGEDARARARRYLERITGSSPDSNGRFHLVLLHYIGCSSRMAKDLSHDTAKAVCSAARLRGRAVAILDMERLSPLVDQSTIFSPLNGNTCWREPGVADPETMAAMIGMAELFIGIDSGPLHVAGACETPSIGVWTHHHPIRFFDLSHNVFHLVPAGHKRFAGGPRAVAAFEQLYKHAVYGDVTAAIIEELDKRLPGRKDPPPPRSEALPGLNAIGYTEQYYLEHVNAGLDYLGHGDWQREYATWLADVFSWRGTRVLDVGCACGSILRGLGHVGVVVQGVDVSEFMVQRGRRKWPDQAALMHVGDAVNLHMFAAGEWQGLHSAQVAEHWRPELVHFILSELARVTAEGGLFFCTLDTQELFARNNREMAHEDKTHVCIQSLPWWHTMLANSGWEVCTDDFKGRLEAHAGSFLKRYDWDYFVARRVPRKG